MKVGDMVMLSIPNPPSMELVWVVGIIVKIEGIPYVNLSKKSLPFYSVLLPDGKIRRATDQTLKPFPSDEKTVP